ncbi:MAG: hypothetical protein IPM99_18825 [Rubrivivax sp.]|nr:hypothetical protein [Rubrivivax sp.]
MKVLSPLTITPGMLTSSTLAETDYSAWNSGTTYAAAARVVYDHKVWESAQAGNTNKVPGAAASATWWLEVGPTNRWAMFDGSVSTASADAADIEVVVTPNAIVDAVAVVAGVGESVRVQMHDGATSVYDQTQSLDSTPISDWEDYFFADQVLAGELLFAGLPRYLSAAITVTLAATPSGQASCGALLLGRLHELGQTQTDASAGITDYSRKETDDWGNTLLMQRSYAKRSQQRMVLDTDDLRRVQALLAGLRATPALWIGDDDTDRFAPLAVFGWYRSFAIDIPGPVLSFCTLEIEGLT